MESFELVDTRWVTGLSASRAWTRDKPPCTRAIGPRYAPYRPQDRYRRSFVMYRAVPLYLMLLASGIAGCAHTHSAAGSLAVATTSAPRSALYQNERTVWSDQVVWMRQYVAATFADDRSARVARNRLALNGEAIGGMLKPYYGETAGAGLTAMLKVQFGITSALIHAEKSGDIQRKEELEKRLHENSNAIARFLAGLNPYWSPTEL